MRSLLPTRKMRPRDPTALVLRPVLEDVRAALPEKHTGKLWAIDIETNGLDATDPACVIVGIGMAREHGVVYVHMQDAPTEVREYVGQFLRGSRLIAFNVFFDGAFLERDFGPMQWELDAYALYKQLSLEGWTGQSWGLESAQTDVLGWPTSNKTALTAALAEHGLSKGEMFKLPPEILGRYCAGDADSTWQLYGVLMDAVKPFPRLWDYHTRIFMTTVRLLIEQQRRGIYVDQTRLAKCRADLATKIDAAMTAFLGHPDVAYFVAQYNQEVHDAWKRAAPPQFKKDGTETARYQNWLAKEATLIAEQGFNPNSKDQLRWLFFDKLGMKSVKTTEGGKGAINKQTLPTLGKPGALLMDYNLYVKRLQFADATAVKSARDGLIHPQFNSVGTVTTRLGGSGGWNAQQLTKSPDYLACLQARDGHRLVQSDVVALEPCILAEFSGDATLMKLYGPGAAEQDIYLFVGAQMPGIGEVIRRYYDPDNPTPESIAAAKKACKRERGIAKVITLSCLAEGTPVRVRGRGWVPIEDVRPGNRVWDGDEWVTTDGAIFKGLRETITLYGVELTPEHKILGSQGEWQRADTIQAGTESTQYFRPKLPGGSWADVWQMACRVFRDATSVGYSLCSRFMRTHAGSLDKLRQFKVR